MARGADHRGHGSIDNDVRWDVKVRDALVRVHHRQSSVVLEGLVKRVLNLVAVVQVRQAFEDGP